MANKYWVGGGSSTNWNATANTNWSDTDGGANNATAPGSGDVAIFNGNSGVGTSVLNTAFTIQKLVCTGYAGTISHSTAVTLTLNTAGVDTLILGSGMTYTPASQTALITITSTSGTADITSAGKRLGGLTLNGVGGTFRLLDALLVDGASASTLTLTNGVFNANNFNVTVGLFSSSNSNIRTITMGSGTWTIGAVAAANNTIWGTATVTNLTFNKDAALVVIASNGGSGTRLWNGGGLAFNGLTINQNAGRGTISFTVTSVTFASLIVGTGNNISLSGITLTIQAAFTIVGTAANPILIFADGAVGTLSVPSGTVSLSFAGLKQITGSGGAAFNALNSFDFGGNTGWAFTTPGDTAAIAAAVWDLATSGHATAGTFGAQVKTVLDAHASQASVDTLAGYVDTEVAAIKAKTDSLTFTVAGQIDANIQYVNDTQVTGNGHSGSEWGPA